MRPCIQLLWFKLSPCTTLRLFVAIALSEPKCNFCASCQSVVRLVQRLDDAAFVLLAFMQFSRQHLWLCPQARTKSWHVACPSVCNKAIMAQLVSTSNGCPQLLPTQRSSQVAGSPSLRQRTTYSSDLHARTVGVRRIVTKATHAPNFVSDGTSLWQWRRTQLCKIAMFTGPALSIPLADPIMSLVDTVCVGQVPKGVVCVTFVTWI